jgi:hypothetical protein
MERLAAFGERALADVDRAEADRQSALQIGLDQQRRLARRPGAELDQLAGAGQRRQLVGAGAQDRGLGACRVVLGKIGDALEQLRAARVVEIAARQRPRTRREAGDDIPAIDVVNR